MGKFNIERFSRIIMEKFGWSFATIERYFERCDISVDHTGEHNKGASLTTDNEPLAAYTYTILLTPGPLPSTGIHLQSLQLTAYCLTKSADDTLSEQITVDTPVA